MLKLQVLRYMGILTVMKLGICVLTAFSLLIAFTWFFVYCPVRVIYSTPPNSHSRYSNVHDTRQHHSVKAGEKLIQSFNKLASDQKESRHLHFDEMEQKMSNKIADTNEQNVIPYEKYTDEAFDRLVDQLNRKDVAGYKIMSNSTNLSIYRRPKGNAGLYEYKLYAIVPKANPAQISAVFLDNEYRLKWDSYVTDLYDVKKNSVGPDIVYFNIDLPWPLANRDYVYARESRRQKYQGEEYTTIVMHSVLHDSIPHVEGVIRVGDYHQSIVMKLYETSGTKMYIEYYDDPKGSIPSWLVNWAAKTGVPSFIEDLQRACSGLDEFLKKNNKPMHTVALHF